MNRSSCEISVTRIRFVRSSEKGNDDDEKEARGSLLDFMEPQHPEEQLKRIGGHLKGIGIPNIDNCCFHKILISIKQISNYMIFTK